MKKGELPTKTCAGCGRPFAWRNSIVVGQASSLSFTRTGWKPVLQERRHPPHRFFQRLHRQSGANNAADGLHGSSGNRPVAVSDRNVIGDRLHADPLHGQADGEDVFVASRRFETAVCGDSRPADGAAVRQMTDDRKSQRPEEVVLDLLHPAIEIRKMNNAGHVRFTELNTARGLEERCH